MNEPIKPEFPTEPNKYLELDSLYIEVCEDGRDFLFADREELIKRTLDKNYKPYTIEGKFELVKISIEYGCCESYVMLTFSGAKVVYENVAYNSLLNQYKKEIIDFPRKMDKYNTQMIKYNEWLAGAKDRELEKLRNEKVRLEVQKRKVEKKLEKYETH